MLDYNRFCQIWGDLKSSYDKVIPNNALMYTVYQVFCSVYEVTNESLERAVYSWIASEPYEPKPSQLIEKIKFDGRTKDEAKTYAAKLFRQLADVVTSSHDIVFSDNRACIAFFNLFTSPNGFGACFRDKSLDRWTSDFVEQYINCRLIDHIDTLRNHKVMFAKVRNTTAGQGQEVYICGDYQQGLAIIKDVYEGIPHRIVRDEPKTPPKALTAAPLSQEECLKGVEWACEELTRICR